MAIEYQFAVRPINIELLDAQLKAASGWGGKIAGITIRDGAVYVIQTTAFTEAETLELGVLYNSHSAAGLTSAQQDRVFSQSALTNIRAVVNATFTQLANDRSAVSAAYADLEAAGSLAAVKPVVSGMLTRQDHTIDTLNKLVSGLWRVIDKLPQ